MRYIVVLFFIVAITGPCAAANFIDTDTLQNVKIISAEKLNYKDGNSTLLGNVEIQISNFHIRAPKVFIDSDSTGSPVKGRFVEGAVLETDDFVIRAPSMELDVQEAMLKCFADTSAMVETVIYGNPGTTEVVDNDIAQASNDTTIYAAYQEFDLNAGFGRATNEGEHNSRLQQVKFISKDTNINSDSIEFEFDDKSDISYVDFLGNVTALADQERIQSQELLYFPAQELFKANDNVKVLYLQEAKSTYLFADAMVYEKANDFLSLFSRGTDRFAEIHSDNVYGKSRQMFLTIDDSGAMDKATLTGNAFAQYRDKSILGYEILFDIQKKQIQTLVGRPHTQILSKS